MSAVSPSSSANTTVPSPGETSTSAIARPDGSILLSVSTDRMYKLNGTGAMTWTVLAGSHQELTAAELTQELLKLFDAINREGQHYFEVEPTQLKADTARILDHLVQLKLLRVVTDPYGREAYRIAPDVSQSAAHFAADEAPVTQPPPSAQPQSAAITETPASASSVAAHAEAPSAEAGVDPLKHETLMAFIELAKADAVLKFSGFEALVKKVEDYPTSELQTMDRDVCKRVRAMVDRAQMYYPKKAMCLQHSSVVTRLLRKRGVPAEMVLAARDYPPEGHAWVEVKSEVVNDSPTVKAKYRELRRV